MIGQQSCAYAYAYANHVLTGNNSDISISISIRGTQGFDILMLMLMLMSRLSSLAHKLLMLMLMLMLASLVRTRLKRYAQRPCFVGVLWGDTNFKATDWHHRFSAQYSQRYHRSSNLLRSRSGRSHVTLPVPTRLLQTDIHSFLGK